MQGRSIGSKRFTVGDAAPQPTRASIYQEEHTPHEWTAPNDLQAQLALPRRRAELHPRALRHGLIASQLGLPMLARDEPKLVVDEWTEPPAEAYTAQDAYAAYGGEEAFNEQTTNYDEWELQKELVTYEQTYAGYDPAYEEHPPLDLQLPPVASGYEQDDPQSSPFDDLPSAYAQQEDSSPGSYPFTQMARHSLQPSAARWHSEQPIRRVASTHPAQHHQADRHAARASHASRVSYNERAATARPAGAQTPAAAGQPTRSTARAAASAQTAARAQAPAAAAGQPTRSTTRAAASAQTAASLLGTPSSAGGHRQPGAPQLQAAQRAHEHRRSSELPQRAARVTTQHSSAHSAPARPNQAPVGSVQRARRFVDDEPVVYPHKRSWLARVLLVLALAGGGYVGYNYYIGGFASVSPALPVPPPSAPVTTLPEPPAAAVEPPAPIVAAPATTPDDAATAQESAKARRSAARAALIAERWRERRAARRGRSDDSSASEDRYAPAAPEQHPSYASAQDDYVSHRHAAAQIGVLRINSLPWSEVHIDGQLVGHTPQMNLQLTAGKHRVTLVNQEMQLSKSFTVQISPGDITTHTIHLAQ